MQKAEFLAKQLCFDFAIRARKTVAAVLPVIKALRAHLKRCAPKTEQYTPKNEYQKQFFFMFQFFAIKKG